MQRLIAPGSSDGSEQLESATAFIFTIPRNGYRFMTGLNAREALYGIARTSKCICHNTGIQA